MKSHKHLGIRALCFVLFCWIYLTRPCWDHISSISTYIKGSFSSTVISIQCFCCHHSTQLISSFFSTNLLTFSLLTSSVHTQEVNEEYWLTGLCYHIPIPSKFIGTLCCTIIQEFSRKIKINARFSVSWIQSRKIMTNLWSKMSCMHNHPKSVQKEPTWAVASSMLTANFHWHPLCKSHLST